MAPQGPRRRGKLPDWLLYVAVIGAVLYAVDRRPSHDAPPRPEPTFPNEGAPLAPASPYDPSVLVEITGPPRPGLGTAFAIDGAGLWLTARHVVDGCRQAAVIVGDDDTAVPADVLIDPAADIALLRTDGGPEPLPSALDRPLRIGQRAFHPGFPAGRPGEATSRLLGRQTLVVSGRGARSEPVLAWAETGRTRGLDGSLAGLSGAPAIDPEGRILGVTIAESPRRGRLYTTSPDTLNRTLALAGATPPPGAPELPVTLDNYGRVADRLRRDLRIAKVVCLAV